MLGFTSQTAASGTNFFVLTSIARVSGITEFGWLALAVGAIMAIVGLSRNMLGTPIALAAGSADELKHESSFGVTLSILMALTVVAPIAILGWHANNAALIACAFAAPFVVAQDTLRQVCIAAGLPGTATTADMFRLTMAALIFVSTVKYTVPPWLIFASWGLGAALASIFQWQRSRWTPTLSGFRSNWRRTRRTRLALLGNGALVQLTPLTNSLLVGAILGAGALSAYRAAGTLLGPVSIVLTTIPLTLIPAIARSSKQDFTSTQRHVLPIAASLSVATLLLALGSVFVPDQWGKALIGESWTVTSQILPIFAAQYALQPWKLTALIAFKVTGRMRQLVQFRAWNSALIISVVAAAATFGTLRSTVIALFTAEAFMTCVYLISARRASNPIDAHLSLPTRAHVPTDSRKSDSATIGK